MKKIILFIMLLVQVSFAQDFVIKDSISYHWQQIFMHAQRISDLEGGENTAFIERIEALERNSELNGINIQALFDSITSHRNDLNGLRSGGGYVPDPFAPSITMTADNDSAKLIIIKTNPAGGTTPDSFRVYLSTDNLTFNWIASFPYASGSYRTGVLNTSTLYYVKLKSLVNGTPIILSEFSNTASATTYTPAVIDPAPIGDWTFDYVVGTNGTLDQIKTIAVAGDTIFIPSDEYDLTSGGSFSKDGTALNPIVWVGELDTADKNRNTLSVDGTKSTLFSANSSSNAPISLSGDYNYFYNIAFQQNYSAKQLISVSGEGVKLDSCTVKYPSNASSSSNHIIVVTGKGVTFRNSTFTNGSRCIIWVRKNSGTQADNFTMEYCELTGSSNHPPIQIMPATNSTDTTTIKHSIVRNCLFIDNPYGDGIYSRYCEQFAFYNNLFIRSSIPFSIDIHTGFHYPTGTPADTCNSKGGIIAYNTIVENGSSNIMFNQGTNQINFLNNIFYSTYSPANGSTVMRFDASWNATKRHFFDYNLYYYTGRLMKQAAPTGLRGTWDGVSIYFTDWADDTGKEIHTLMDIAPTFTNASTDDYSPLNSSSPQKGVGIPITTANGFWMNITTDYNGNPRHATAPTIGAIGLSGYDY